MDGDRPEANRTDGRRYYRAEASVVVHYGDDDPQTRAALALDRQIWATAGKLEEKAREIFTERDAEEDILPLLDLLKWLDYKLDMVLFFLRRNDRQRYFPRQAATSDISGSGVTLAGEEALDPAKDYLLSISLPDAPSRPVVCLAAPVGETRELQDGKYISAMDFKEISDVDRERIIRFTFEQQRRQLAARSREEQI